MLAERLKVQRFNSNLENIKNLLAELQEHTESQTKIEPEQVSWANVGVSGMVLEVLVDVTNFIFSRGEYGD